MSLQNDLLESSWLDFGTLRPRFWSLQASIWESPASILKPPGSIVEPPGLLPSFGHASHIQQHDLTNVGQSLAWGSFLFCFWILNRLAKVWEAAVSPLGAFNGIGSKSYLSDWGSLFQSHLKLNVFTNGVLEASGLDF